MFFYLVTPRVTICHTFGSCKGKSIKGILTNL